MAGRHVDLESRRLKVGFMNISYETQSDQVAAEMERGIRTGTFPPGSRLPSIRELADVFHVSTQVIKSAFKMLMERRLLVSRSRIGVFVNVDGVLPGMKKLILLNETRAPHDPNYLGRVFGLSESIMTHQGFHVQMRSVPNGPLLLTALRYELHQIDMERPDCLIINASTVAPDQIEQIRNRKYPVLFFGDFVHGDVPGLQYDLIRERTEERGLAYMEALHRIGCRNVCLFGGNPEFEYVRRLLNAVRMQGELYGIRVHVSSGSPVERQEEGVVDDWKRHIQNVLRVFSPDAFIMDGFGRLELFLRALKEFGFSPGKDIQVIGDSDFTPGLVMIRSDYREFIRSAAAVIHRIIEEPGYHCGIMEISGKIKRTPFKIEAL